MYRRRRREKFGRIGKAVLTLSEHVELQTKIDELTNIKLGQKLGGGQFGEVYYGTWNGETAVALKKLKDSNQIESFMKE